MKQISEQDKKEIRRAAREAVAQCLIAGHFTAAVGKMGEVFYNPRKPINWETVSEQLDEMDNYVVTALTTLRVARAEMKFIKTKQLELKGPRKAE
nr:MAG TPA: hypothetical protein [Caudoviricetes sp.]